MHLCGVGWCGIRGAPAPGLVGQVPGFALGGPADPRTEDRAACQEHSECADVVKSPTVAASVCAAGSWVYPFFLVSVMGRGLKKTTTHPIRIAQKETSPALRLLLRTDRGHSGFLCLKREAVCPTSGLHTCGPAAFRSLYPSMAGTAPRSAPL